jgi:hypothetical protein
MQKTYNITGLTPSELAQLEFVLREYAKNASLYAALWAKIVTVRK